MNTELTEFKKKEIEKVARQIGDSEIIFNEFIKHLAPCDVTKILTHSLMRGMEFTWRERDDDSDL